MKIKIIAVGKIKDTDLLSLWEQYRVRFRVSPLLIEIPDKFSGQLSAIQRQGKERDLIQEHLKDQEAIVCLDSSGKTFASEALACKIETLTISHKGITFLIGGADGLHPDLLNKAHLILSFGSNTWPHKLVRIMLIEQLYRAQQILMGHPYHH